ncbi:MAG: SH3 domain-containing protein [Desulfobacteraceae bacterium]|nr:MAG: SH3 domain-containing protein [Desulfobacteraceae bacterium]
MIRKTALVCVSLILVYATYVFPDGLPMSVQVRSSQLRLSPSFLARVVELVSYGDRVSMLQRQAGWAEVRTINGRQGWIHESALSDKKIVLNPGKAAARVDASGKEITLAGKGFNPETEREFRSRHAEADFASVDRMEAIKLTPAQIQSFLKSGSLKLSEGDVR